MPISNWDQIPAIMNEVYRLQPKTVLDLGIGFGKYGPLLREVLDGMHGRCDRELWEASIWGVESFDAYSNPVWGGYSGVIRCDFTDLRRIQLGGNDLVLMLDSLEHLEPGAGRVFLDDLVAHNRHVIVSVPVVPMPQGTTYGNPFEAHRTHHDGTEFARFNPVTLYKGITQVFSIKGIL